MHRHLRQAGGLIAHGMDRHDLYWRAATYVDRILEGAKSADLPMERPTKFDLVINLSTDQALGLTIPSSILQQATEILHRRVAFYEGKHLESFRASSSG
jgi:putative tryptophan/tyrosine transport system substrate-binding protein